MKPASREPLVRVTAAHAPTFRKERPEQPATPEVRIQFRHHASPDMPFDPGTFARQIGKNIPLLDEPDGVAIGTLLAAETADDGRSVLFTATCTIEVASRMAVYAARGQLRSVSSLVINP